MDRRNITPALFEKENIGRGAPHGIQHPLSFRQHPSSSSPFELPLGSIPDKMNFASLPLAPPPPSHGGSVGMAQPQMQMVTTSTAPVHLDHQLAAYPQNYHPTGAVSYRQTLFTLFASTDSLSLSLSFSSYRLERVKLPIRDSLSNYPTHHLITILPESANNLYNIYYYVLGKVCCWTCIFQDIKIPAHCARDYRMTSHYVYTTFSNHHYSTRSWQRGEANCNW